MGLLETLNKTSIEAIMLFIAFVYKKNGVLTLKGKSSDCALKGS